MEALVLVLVSAVLVEAVVDWIKAAVEGLYWQKVAALGVALIVMVTLQLDIFVILGLDPALPYVGMVILAIIVSRGANYVQDLFDRVNNFRSI